MSSTKAFRAEVFVPFLAVVHLKDLVCKECGARIAEPGARSFIVDGSGAPVAFDENAVPEAMVVEITCPNGHPNELYIPNEVSAEETLATPDGAPIAADAVLSEN
jgi:hypothetical protein